MSRWALLLLVCAVCRRVRVRGRPCAVAMVALFHTGHFVISSVGIGVRFGFHSNLVHVFQTDLHQGGIASQFPTLLPRLLGGQKSMSSHVLVHPLSASWAVLMANMCHGFSIPSRFSLKNERRIASFLVSIVLRTGVRPHPPCFLSVKYVAAGRLPRLVFPSHSMCSCLLIKLVRACWMPAASVGFVDKTLRVYQTVDDIIDRAMVILPFIVRPMACHVPVLAIILSIVLLICCSRVMLVPI